MTHQTLPTDSPPIRAVFDLAWPMTLKAIMLHGIVVIDALLVAPLGEATLAAMGLAGALAGLILGVLFAFSTAMQIRVAQAFGSGRAVTQKSTFWCGMAVNLVCAALGLIFIMTAAPAVLSAFGQSADIAAEAQRYLAVFAIVVLAEAVGQGLTSQFNGCGDARVPFYSYLLSQPINVGLSLVLIHGQLGFPALGLMGAAIGTAVAAVLRGMILAAIFHRRTGSFAAVAGWSGGSFLAAMRRHLVFSLPIAATFVSSTSAVSLCRLFYARLGVTDFAAMTLILPWVQVAGTVGMAWAQATGLIIAQLLGRGTSDAAVDAFLRRTWRAAFVAAGLVALAYVVISLGSAQLYADLRPETLAALLSFLPLLVVLPFPKQSNAICGNTLRAGGDTVFVMNVFVAGQWMFTVPLTALFVYYLHVSVTWVFALLLLEELVKFPAFHLRLMKGKWKRPPVED